MRFGEVFKMDLVKDSVFNQQFESESELIDVKSYFDEFSKMVTPFLECENETCKIGNGCGSETCRTDEIYRDYLDISQEELKELKERTSIDLLTCEDEVEYYTHDQDGEKDEATMEMEEPNSSLVSVGKRWEMNNITKTQFPRTYYKYCNYEWCIWAEKVSKIKAEYDNLEFPTIVACIKVYHPFTSKRNKTLRVKLLQEIHILGQQTLADFKDKIVCSLDYIGDKDVSNECFLKEVGHNVTSKDEYPSSFIFMENTFYNDTRSPKMNDLSKELKEWAEARNLGTFKTAVMEETKINSLNVKVGRPYVYQHQGNCEHIIVFSDIRLLDSSDPDKLNYFPRIHCTGRTYGKHCMMCSEFYARWLVVGNDRLTHDKAYLCTNCFVSYNYLDGKKIGKFEAYRYVDPVAIL